MQFLSSSEQLTRISQCFFLFGTYPPETDKHVFDTTHDPDQITNLCTYLNGEQNQIIQKFMLSIFFLISNMIISTRIFGSCVNTLYIVDSGASSTPKKDKIFIVLFSASVCS